MVWSLSLYIYMNTFLHNQITWLKLIFYFALSCLILYIYIYNHIIKISIETTDLFLKGWSISNSCFGLCLFYVNQDKPDVSCLLSSEVVVELLIDEWLWHNLWRSNSHVEALEGYFSKLTFLTLCVLLH